MKLTMLGTGNALVTKCYNTCFVIGDNKDYFMVDAGGGNGVFHQLEATGLSWKDMKHIFVTHQHLDHMMGIIWMMRMITQYSTQGEYDGEAYIYGHDELIKLLDEMAHNLLLPKEYALIGEKLHFVAIQDSEAFEVIGHKVKFFDIHSTKTKQFGFTMYYRDEKKLTCCGDEPYTECERQYVEGCEWLMHEAFCLYEDREIFKPYEKHHSTVKDACQLAEQLGVKNLLLYHTEDRHIGNRKELYIAEGSRYYHGNLYVPDDLETIEL